jgi:hypothetical protein
VKLKHGIEILIVLVAGLLLAWAFFTRRQEKSTEAEREQPVKAAAQVVSKGGENLVVLDAAAQKQSGIEVAALASAGHREEIRALGTVMDLRELVDLAGRYAAARADQAKAQAGLAASHAEYERLKRLHQDQHNISDKVFQGAEAAWRSDQAQALSAQLGLQALESMARQQWGPVLAQALFNASPEFERLVRQQEFLILVTLPADVKLSSAPAAVRVQSASSNLAPAVLLSASPRADPRIQGISFFYTASAPGAGFLPGMDVSVLLPVGSEVRGVVVPGSAVVWWEGKAWTYVEKSPGKFVRREIPTGQPLEDGWFAARGFTAGDRVTVQGAELLLSEEFRARFLSGED